MDFPSANVLFGDDVSMDSDSLDGDNGVGGAYSSDSGSMAVASLYCPSEFVISPDTRSSEDGVRGIREFLLSSPGKGARLYPLARAFT